MIFDHELPPCSPSPAQRFTRLRQRQEEPSVEGLTVADARWLSNLLKRLSDDQIKDAFRAANYAPDEIDALTAAVRARANALANPAAAVTAQSN